MSDKRAGSSLAARIAIPFYNVSPNLLSILSLIFAALSGILYYMGDLLFYLPSIIIASGLDAVDGEVARHQGRASLKGDLLDHFIDRYSDIFIILGISLSSYGNILLGLLGIEGVLMTSYMGTQAQALGAKRDYKGILGRVNRLIILILLAPVQYLFRYSYSIFGLTLNPTTFVLLLFFFLGNATAISRFARLYKTI